MRCHADTAAKRQSLAFSRSLKSTPSAQGSLQGTTSANVHQLQDVFVIKRLQPTQTSFWLKDRKSVVVLTCCEVVHYEAIHDAAPQGVAGWYRCVNAALLLLEL